MNTRVICFCCSRRLLLRRQKLNLVDEVDFIGHRVTFEDGNKVTMEKGTTFNVCYFFSIYNFLCIWDDVEADCRSTSVEFKTRGDNADDMNMDTTKSHHSMHHNIIDTQYNRRP